jgi:hypothetical protein
VKKDPEDKKVKDDNNVKKDRKKEDKEEDKDKGFKNRVRVRG